MLSVSATRLEAHANARLADGVEKSTPLLVVQREHGHVKGV